MKLQTILLLICFILVLPFSHGRRHRREAALTLRSSPKLAIQNETEELNIECLTPASLSDVMMAIFIHLEKTDANDTTVHFATLRLNKLQTVEDSRVSAEGRLQTSDSETSTLLVKIKNPVVEDSATYTCKFLYLDSALSVKTLTKRVNVTVSAVVPENYIPLVSSEQQQQCDCGDVWSEINKIKATLVKDNELLRSSLQSYDETCKVSFSAKFSQRDDNPFVKESILVFNSAISNKGAAYDVNTGEFTAPCSGQYFFMVTLRTHQDLDSGYVDGVLQVDGQELARTSAHVDAPIENLDTASNGVVVSLKKGQKVSVVTQTTSTGSIVGDSFSTFTGFFLSP